MRRRDSASRRSCALALKRRFHIPVPRICIASLTRSRAHTYAPLGIPPRGACAAHHQATEHRSKEIKTARSAKGHTVCGFTLDALSALLNCSMTSPGRITAARYGREQGPTGRSSDPACPPRWVVIGPSDPTPAPAQAVLQEAFTLHVVVFVDVSCLSQLMLRSAARSASMWGLPSALYLGPLG